MRRFVIVAYVVALCLIAAHAQQQPPRRFPSAMAGFVLCSAWQAPTDQDTINDFMSRYGSATAQDTMRWELEHADMFVADFGYEINRQHVTLVYEYFHTIRLYYNDVDDMIKWAVRNGKNHEDFSVHFKEDTVVNSTFIKTVNTFWMGRLGAGVARNTTGTSGRIIDDGGDVFRWLDSGGAFYIWGHLPFYEIQIDLSRPGVGGTSLIIEYPSAVDENFRVTQWSPVTVIHDGTNLFSNSGVIRIHPPSDWKAASTYPYDFTETRLRNGFVVYPLRIRAYGFSTRPLVSSVSCPVKAMEYVDAEPWIGAVHSGLAQSGSTNTIVLAASASTESNRYRYHVVKIVAGTGSGQERVITAYNGTTREATVDVPWTTIPDETSEYKIVRRAVRIRGWDPANDRNGDGFVDDAEFASLVNPNATARMRHYSRVIFIGAWADSSAWNVANTFNPDYRQAVAETTYARWQRMGVRGCHIDDVTGNGLGTPWAAKSGAIQPYILQGGRIWEYEGARADQDEPTGLAWFEGYIETIRLLKQVSGSNWIGGNISNRNPFVDYYTSRVVEVFDWFDCEDTLKYQTRVNSWGGLMLRPGWIYPAINALGKRVLLYFHHRNYNSLGINNRETWEYNAIYGLAYYYMVNVPNLSYVVFWNHSFWYNSQNTTTSLYWKAGVPKNYAYQPTRMMAVDIGVPANTIPEGKRPMHLQWDVGPYMYKIGDTTSTQVVVPTDSGEEKVLPIVPTYIYILKQVTDLNSRTYTGQWGLQVPADAVYARNYTKGLILMRLMHAYAGIPSTTYENHVTTVDLPGTYRVLRYDGTLGPPVTQVSIRGGEAMILVATEEVPSPQPSVQITIAADKTNPKPLDVVTVTITATNTGDGEARNVRITHDIPQGATFVRGSLKLNGNALPDPTDTTKIDVTVTSISAGGQVVVQFQMVIR